jgi:hypothetical protein
MATTKKHKHKYTTFVRWLRSPWEPDNISYYWSFSVDGRCECGAIGKRDANLSEVEDYIRERTCKDCGKFDSETPHTSTAHCFNELRTRVDDLEKIIEGMRNSLRGV